MFYDNDKKIVIWKKTLNFFELKQNETMAFEMQ